MSRDSDLRLIDAGAIVTGAVSGEFVDAVTARSYDHPSLEGRTVVRLVPEALGGAEDLAMEFLGFGHETPPVVVGRGRRQALGFPAWALINDPANGHHALALVKDIERLSRMAKSKPGNAKDGFEELALRLGRSVPHFLPTFYEQAARAFVVAENKATGAVLFGKAREAERVHALTIDEDRQRDVFLEFAFSGALSAKSLTQHAKDLAVRTTPADAYQLFLRICLERVTGGLPPYAGMAEDLRRLAKAAGLSVAEQDQVVIAELIDAPALPRAAMAFWRAYRPTLVTMAKADPTVRDALLGVFPAVTQDGLEEFWFDLLESAGIPDYLTTEAPGAVAADWLERALLWRRRGYRSTSRSQRFLDLVEKMADRLRMAGRPLALVPANLLSSDLDVIDLCLSLTLELAAPEGTNAFPVARWMHDLEPGRRDLLALCGAEWAQPGLLSGVDAAMSPRGNFGRSEVVTVTQLRPLIDSPGGHTILARWLGDKATQLENAALPGAETALLRLTAIAHDEVFAIVPGLAARLQAVNLGAALARTLRAGIFDEFGWPALEEAAEEYPVDAKKAYWERNSRSNAWPALVLSDRIQATAVGPDGVLDRHQFRIPADSPPDTYAPVRADYLDGQFLVVWSSGGKRQAYWSGRPREVFGVPSSLLSQYQGDTNAGLPMPDGSRATGGRPLVAGEKAAVEPRQVVSDGQSFWRLDPSGWREFDPATGSAGRSSLPAFFEAGLVDDRAQLVPGACFLAPVPAGFESTPLGTANGLLGWRVVRKADGSIEGESVSGSKSVGRSVTGYNRPQPSAVLAFPGAGGVIGVSQAGSQITLVHNDLTSSSFTLADRRPGYAAGTPYVPPIEFWHALRPRDAQGSAALRAMTDTLASTLLTQDAASALPAVKDANLRAGIDGCAAIARRCVTRQAALPRGENAATIRTATAPIEVISDLELGSALAGLISRDGTFQRHYGGAVRPATALASLASIVAVLGEAQPKKGLRARMSRKSEDAAAGDFVETRIDLRVLVGGLGAIALRAASAATPEKDRKALCALLRAVRETPLAEPDGSWRALSLKAPGNARDFAAGSVIPTAGGRAVVLSSGENYLHGGGRSTIVTAIERGGNFGDVPGYTIAESWLSTGWGGAAAITELLGLIASRGPAPWSVSAVETFAADTGVTRAEAALLIAGLPNIDSYERMFLSKETRELLGLKLEAALTARDQLAKLNKASRLMLCHRALPQRLADLWDVGPAVGEMAKPWIKGFGRRIAVPDELIAEFGKAMPRSQLTASNLMQGLLAPGTCAWLSEDKQFSIVNNLLSFRGAAGGFDSSSFAAAGVAIVWLAYRLPRESPIRASLPAAAAAIRQRLVNPELLLPIGGGSNSDAIRASYGLPASEPQSSSTAGVFPLGTTGLLVDRAYHHEIFVRPAQLSPGDPLLAYEPEYGGVAGHLLRVFLDPGFDRLMASLAESGQGWAQDPFVSAPGLLPDVMAALEVDEPAARFYLQTLALPDPTDKNIGLWNSWTPAEVRAVAAGLVEAGHLVTGKRSRAGRSSFLPGGWLDVKAPILPLEVWKVSLLGRRPDGGAPLGVNAPTLSCVDLFHAAWGRVVSGEGPGLEQLVTRRRR